VARSRNIKPGFFKNEELAECQPLARILYAGLWTISDREGRMEFRPKRIKAELLPYDDCKISELLNELIKHGFIIHYSVDELEYIEVPTFLDHQNPHHKEAESTIPASDSPNARIIKTLGLSSASLGQNSDKPTSNPADSLNPITDSLIPLNGIPKSKARNRKKRDTTEGKTQYAEFVWMIADKEYGKLVRDYGESAVARMIDILDNYKGANGKTYSSDYRAILTWVIDRYKEEQNKGGGYNGKPISPIPEKPGTVTNGYEEYNNFSDD
jgi:hypothetical protein